MRHQELRRQIDARVRELRASERVVFCPKCFEAYDKGITRHLRCSCQRERRLASQGRLETAVAGRA